ncbi:hypothetical protein SAMN05444392_10383 [Seinonella peptonophila]|uniref:Uncharacterized protein n=1 Tax=Seinonella peptonophila TaxID=112248 RepID=A0A1M4W7R2_9BACL|nr:hypothetical protein [Seinonella peptonophila]SHE77301.1 hypothetical protein SAMN05444392_10383 [Seinonella peptonophila]
MNAKHGYRCENCGRFDAKYEARIAFEGRNLLLCFTCLKKIKQSIQRENNTDKASLG